MTTRTIAYLSLIALVFVVLPALAVALLAMPRAAAEEPREAEGLPPARSQDEIPARYMGTSSCTAAACHGSRDLLRTAAVGREYRIWVEQDPHSKAFSTLYSDASRRIVVNLRLKTEAYQSPVCLSCHSIDVPEGRLAEGHRHTIQDGVGCEACHGPAEKWLAMHSRLEWQGLSASEKAEYGFRDTADLPTRARACVECHVGSPGREVNHDLIAAGHPRLNFELSAYQANLPRHWSRDKDKLENGPALEARLWAIGQLESVSAALTLLEQRAADEESPWPEFAEYDCFACHRDLQGAPGADVDSLTWGSWHTPLLSFAHPQTPALQTSLESLRKAMQGPYKAVDREEVQRAAEALRKTVDAAAENAAGNQFSRGALLKRLSDITDLPARRDEQPQADLPLAWDEATQRYLAVVALRQALVDLHQAAEQPPAEMLSEAKEPLNEIRDKLAYPEGYDSPKDFDADKQQQIRELFRAIHNRLE